MFKVIFKRKKCIWRDLSKPLTREECEAVVVDIKYYDSKFARRRNQYKIIGVEDEN